MKHKSIKTGNRKIIIVNKYNQYDKSTNGKSVFPAEYHLRLYKAGVNRHFLDRCVP